MSIRCVQRPQRTLRARIAREIRANWQLYLLVLPGVIFLLLFRYWPMLGIQIAFRDFKPIKGIWCSPWAAERGQISVFKHFIRFLNSAYSLRIIGNTLAVSVYSLLAEFPCCILLALMMNELRSERFKKAVQFVTYAPHFISTIVLVGIMQQLFAYPSALMRTGGVVNTLFQALGGSPVPFMTSETAFRHMYVWSSVWQNVGWGSIIYMATLSGVDPQQYEAALLDGASKLQRVWYITLPALIPTAVTLFILNLGSLMSVGFEKAFAMQNDLNRTTAQVLSTYVYTQGLVDSNYSFATAVDLFNSVINLIAVVTVNAIGRKVAGVSLW